MRERGEEGEKRGKEEHLFDKISYFIFDTVDMLGFHVSLPMSVWQIYQFKY